MKKLVLLFWMLSCTMLLMSQTPENTSNEFRKIAAKGKLLAYDYARSSDDFSLIISNPSDAFVKYMDTLTLKKQLIVSNTDKILKALERTKDEFGLPNSNARFINKSGEVSVVPYPNNTTQSIIFRDLIYSSVFNTVKLSADDRCEKMARDLAMPFLARISEYFGHTQHIGVSVVYGAKDFTNKYESPKYDVLIVITDAKSANQYYNMQITEQDFISKCYFFLDESEFSHSIMKRIELRY